jgi:hypothetical protein
MRYRMAIMALMPRGGIQNGTFGPAMDWIRREFLKLASVSALVAPAMLARGVRAAIAQMPSGAAGF